MASALEDVFAQMSSEQATFMSSLRQSLQMAQAQAAQSWQQLANTVRGYFQQAVGFTQYSDPGRMERLAMAFDDLYASIGSALTPIVDAAVLALDQLNQVITSVVPIIKPAIAKLAEMFEFLVTYALAQWQPLVQTLADLFSELVDTLKPAFDELRQPLNDAAAAVRSFLIQFRPQIVATLSTAFEVLGRTVMGLANLFNSIMRLFGFAQAVDQARPEGPRSSAARAPTYMDNAEVSRQAIATAFGARSEQRELLDAQIQNAAAVRQQIPVMERLTELFNNINREIDSAVGRLVDALLALPARIGAAIQESLPRFLGGGNRDGEIGGGMLEGGGIRFAAPAPVNIPQNVQDRQQGQVRDEAAAEVRGILDFLRGIQAQMRQPGNPVVADPFRRR